MQFLLDNGAEILLEVLGVNDVIRCFGDRNVGACIWTLVNVASIGLMLLKLPKIASAVSKVTGGVAKFLEASSAGRKALDLMRKAAGVARAACSFSGDTQVLMADGRGVRMDSIRAGDVVLSTDPVTGVTAAKPVAAVLPHSDQLLTLETTAGDITTTEDHPYWNVTDGEWQESQTLGRGDRLLSADGRLVTVERLDWSTIRRDTAYDLTVSGFHTFYVSTGSAHVLVHNCEEAFEYAARAEKLAHLFAEKHKFGPLVERFGSQEAVVRAMLDSIAGRTPASGVFELTSEIGGQTVVIRGAVVDGVRKLGTAFTP